MKVLWIFDYIILCCRAVFSLSFISRRAIRTEVDKIEDDVVFTFPAIVRVQTIKCITQRALPLFEYAWLNMFFFWRPDQDLGNLLAVAFVQFNLHLATATVIRTYTETQTTMCMESFTTVKVVCLFVSFRMNCKWNAWRSVDRADQRRNCAKWTGDATYVQFVLFVYVLLLNVSDTNSIWYGFYQ